MKIVSKKEMQAIMKTIGGRKTREHQLKDSELKYRRLFEAAQDGILILNGDTGRIVDANPFVSNLLGYTRTELLGKLLWEIGAFRDIDASKISYTELQQKKYIRYDCLPLETKGKRLIDVEFVSNVYQVDGSRIIQCNIRDVSAHKQLDLLLRQQGEQSEEKFRSFMENAPDGVYLSDLKGNFLYGNRKCEELTGYKREEMIGKNFLELNLLQEKSLATAAELLQDSIDGKSTGPDDLVLIRKDGSLIPVEINTSVLKPNGQVVVLAFIRDITVRKKSEESLRESERQYRALITQSPDGIFIVNLKGTFLSVNRIMCEDLKYSEEELLSMSIWDIVPEQYRDLHKKRMADIVMGKAPNVAAEYVVTGKDGIQHYIEVLSTPYYEGKALIGYQGIARNITERKKAEEDLLKSYEKVKKTLNDAINTMAKIVEMRDPYTAGHELRVAKLATAIAKQIGCGDDQIEQIRMAAVIHDIGKIYVPSDILSKPGKITDNEFNLIKGHAQGGYDIAKGMDFPCSIARSILQHHERLDGSGYPNGLKGEDISLEAKILSVSDVVEAMSSHRPYRPAQGMDKALEEISKNKGRLYDPDVVDACLAVFNSGKFEFNS